MFLHDMLFSADFLPSTSASDGIFLEFFALKIPSRLVSFVSEFLQYKINHNASQR